MKEAMRDAEDIDFLMENSVMDVYCGLGKSGSCQMQLYTNTPYTQDSFLFPKLL